MLTERPVLTRRELRTANGWHVSVEIRFKDGLRAPGCLLCMLLGSSVLRLSICIALKRIRDSEGPASVGLGQGRRRLGAESGGWRGPRSEGGWNLCQRVKPRTLATPLAGQSWDWRPCVGSARCDPPIVSSCFQTRGLALHLPWPGLRDPAASPGFAAEWALNDGGLT